MARWPVGIPTFTIVMRRSSLNSPGMIFNHLSPCQVELDIGHNKCLVMHADNEYLVIHTSLVIHLVLIRRNWLPAWIEQLDKRMEVVVFSLYLIYLYESGPRGDNGSLMCQHQYKTHYRANLLAMLLYLPICILEDYWTHWENNLHADESNLGIQPWKISMLTN